VTVAHCFCSRSAEVWKVFFSVFNCFKRPTSQEKTRNLGQSPTWVRPAL